MSSTTTTCLVSSISYSTRHSRPSRALWMPASSSPSGLPTRRGSLRNGPTMNFAAALATSGGSRSAKARRAGGAVPSSYGASRGAVSPEQTAYGFSAVDDVTLADSLAGLSEGPERLGVGYGPGGVRRLLGGRRAS